ncbi:SPASM domain-containing protein [bacterium]|nr:SPASM domain-containing protein [bacterium]
MKKIPVHYVGDDRETILQQPTMSREKFIEVVGWDHPSINFDKTDWNFAGKRTVWSQNQIAKESNNTIHNDDLLGCFNIEFNVTDLCNRRCWMCPHTNEELFPNSPGMMQLNTVKNVVDTLIDYNYRNGITFGSWGEPWLNPNIVDMVAYVSEKLPLAQSMLYTNGDRLLKGSIPGYGEIDIKDFMHAGLTELHVDIYDNDERCAQILNKMKPIIGVVNLVIHRRYKMVNSTIFLTRAGTMDPLTGLKPTDNERRNNKRLAQKMRKCFAPIAGAFIDVDGSTRACCHEWNRELPIGGNVNDTPFPELYRHSESMNKLRKTLLESRTLVSPCDQCDAAGGIRSRSGKYAEELWQPVLDKL